MYGFCKKIFLVFVLISDSLITFSQQTCKAQLVSIIKVSNNNVGIEYLYDVTKQNGNMVLRFINSKFNDYGKFY